MTLWRMIVTAINLVGLRLGGAALGLFTQVFLARLLAPEDVGVVLMAMSAAAIISLAMTVGYPTMSLTMLPRYYAFGRRRLVKAYQSAALRDAITSAIAIAAMVFLAWRFLPLSEGIRTAILFGLVVAPASSLIRLTSSTANSRKRFTLSYVPDFIFRPGLLLAVLAGAWISGVALSLHSILWVFVAVTASVAVGQAWILGPKEFISNPYDRDGRKLARILRWRAMSLVIVAAVSAAFADIVTLAGGLFLPAGDVAVLGIAIRLAALAGFVTQVTQQFMLPDLTAAVARREQGIAGILLRVNAMTIAAISACVIAVVVLGPPILRVFGEQYVEGHVALVLFMVGQLIRATGGMNQYILSIGGHQTRTALPCLAAIAVLLTLMALLCPAYGVMGAAIAVLVTEATWALALAFQAQHHAGWRGDILAVLKGRN